MMRIANLTSPGAPPVFPRVRLAVPLALLCCCFTIRAGAIPAPTRPAASWKPVAAALKPATLAQKPAGSAATPGSVTLTSQQWDVLMGQLRAAAEANAQAARQQPVVGQDVTLQPGQQHVVQREGLTEVAIVDPNTVGLVVPDRRTLIFTAKKVGDTLVFLNHGGGRESFRVTVVAPPAPDLQQVATQIEAGINRPGVSVRGIGRLVFLEGEVANQSELNRILAILAAFQVEARNLLSIRPRPAPPAPPPAARTAAEAARAAIGDPRITVKVIGDGSIAIEGLVQTTDEADRIRRLVAAVAQGVEVVDLLMIPAPEPPTKRQIFLRARVVDINRDRKKSLGLDYGPNPLTIIQTQPPPFESFFGGGGLNRIQPFSVSLSALVEQGAARILSEPSMTVVEGNRGSILVGGEFPYPAVQSVGSATTTATQAITITFKEFGVRLAVEPTQITATEATLRVAPEVSLLDFSQSIIISGFALPSLRTRRAESVVRIQNGQTFAIGGLLQDEFSQAVKALPLLSRIPVLGELFKTRNFRRGQSELVILVTADILGPGEVPPNTVEPNEVKRPQAPRPH